MADMEPTKRIDSLFERISALIEQARGYVVNSVKIAEVKTRYEVGRLKSFAELGGSTAFGLPEETVKMAECVETTGETNLGNRVLCRQ